MREQKRNTSFKQYNDFLVKPLETRMEGAPIRGVAFDSGTDDPIEPLACSNDEQVRNLFLIVSEFRNDLHICKTLPDEFPPGEAYDNVRFKYYVLVVGCIINAVNLCLREIITTSPEWRTKLTPALSKKIFDDRARLRDRTKVSFQAFDRVFRLESHLDLNGHSWQAFLKMTRIRDNFVHPSSLSDLILSEKERDDFLLGWNWFCSYFPKLIDAYSIKLELKQKVADLSTVAFFTETDLISEIPSKERRDFEKEKDKRDKDIKHSLLLPKTFARQIMPIYLATQTFEDVFFTKTDNAVFQVRLAIITSFGALEARLSMIRKAIELQYDINPKQTMSVTRKLINSKIASRQELRRELSRLEIQNKFKLFPAILARSLDFKWVGYEKDYEAVLMRYIQIRDSLHHAQSYKGLQMNNSHYKVMTVAYTRMRDNLDELLSTREVRNIFSAKNK